MAEPRATTGHDSAAPGSERIESALRTLKSGSDGVAALA